MSEKLTEFNSNSRQNPHFTDTGSAKIVKIAESQDNSSQNNAFLTETTEKSATASENSRKNEVFSEKSEEIDKKSSDIAENGQTKAQSEQKEPPNTENASTNINLFSPENVQAFSKDFPDVNLYELQKSENFQAFIGILTKNPTLSQVYAGFNAIVASIEEKSQKKLIQTMANAKASPGALSSSKESAIQYFTREQVLKMTPEQIKANYSQIRKSQEKW